jgi:hypothetical protein
MVNGRIERIPEQLTDLECGGELAGKNGSQQGTLKFIQNRFRGVKARVRKMENTAIFGMQYP